MTPTITVTIEMTAAKIGRSMKKREMFIRQRALGAAARRRRRTAAAMVFSSGSTTASGRARCTPLMMTRSAGVSPSRTTRSPSCSGPILTWR